LKSYQNIVELVDAANFRFWPIAPVRHRSPLLPFAKIVYRCYFSILAAIGQRGEPELSANSGRLQILSKPVIQHDKYVINSA
jgi:hypothetical protein